MDSGVFAGLSMFSTLITVGLLDEMGQATYILYKIPEPIVKGA